MFANVVVTNVALVAPLIGVPFKFHWYVGDAPMFAEEFTLNVTDVAGQIADDADD